MVFCSRSIITLILLVSFIGIAFAVVPTTEPCWVKGTATAGTGITTVEGLTVGAYLGSTLLKSGTIDANGIYSLNSIGANDGDTIVMKVYGADFNEFTFEGFCKTGTDPWVISNFTVSKVANGESCSSSAICTSGNCSSGVCAVASTGGSPGGGGSGSGGGSSGTTFTPGTTVISDTNETLDNNQVELRNTLEGMKDEEGNPLYTAEEIAQMLANSNYFEFTRTVLVQKIVSEDGTVTYKVTITISVKNKSTNDLKDIIVVIEVPKAIASDASSVTSLLPFTTIVNDPILEFGIARLNAGQSASITYSATSTTNPNVNNVTFSDPIIKTSTIVPLAIPDETPDTTPGDNTNVTPGNDNDVSASTGMDFPGIILIVIIILVIIGGIYYFAKKKKK